MKKNINLLSSYEPVLNLWNRGIIKGFEDGTFKPNQSVTRGQAAKIFVNTLELDTSNINNPNFDDVKQNHPYYHEIAVLSNAGTFRS